jgi:hypothetical protein
MSRAQVDAIRAQSKAGNSGPWQTHYEEMAKKTVIRRLFKYLPVSIEIQKAVGLDEQAEAGIDQQNAAFAYGEIIEADYNVVQPEKPTLNEAEFTAIAEQVKTGDAEYEQIIAQYDLTAEQKDLLDKL